MDATKFKLKYAGSSDFLSCQLYPKRSKAFSPTEHEHDLLLFAQIHHFSDEEYHRPRESNSCTYIIKHECFNYTFMPEIIPNDISDNCKPRVSLIFAMNLPSLEFVVLSCSISVIDRFNHERYTQSYRIMADTNNLIPGLTEFSIDEFLSRESLLKDAAELLPNDCLKLRISLNIRMRFVRDPTLQMDNMDPLSIFPFRENLYYTTLKSEANTILFLDSDIGRFLCSKSKVFQAMAETDMLEKKFRFTWIPEERMNTLRLIFEIFLGTEDIIIKDFNDIYEMLILKDYYDIEGISEACRGILKSFLFTEDPYARSCAANNIENLIELPPHIREIPENFIQSSLEIFRKQEFDELNADANETKESKLETKWTCKFLGNGKYPYFRLSREYILPETKPNLDFYQ